MALVGNYPKVRDILIQEIEKSVVGPYGGAEEILPYMINPTGTYWSGVLYPKETPGGEEESEKNPSKNTEDESFQESIPNIGLKPSSFGLTCTIKENAKNVNVEIYYGKYSQKIIRYGEKNQSRYQRNPFYKAITIPLVGKSEDKIPLDEEKTFYLKYYVRKHKEDYILTVFLINDLIFNSKEKEIIKKCFFQPKMKLTSPNPSERIFVDSSSDFQKANPDDPESMLFALLFHTKKNFAIGHGCSVEWDVDDVQDNSVTSIQTTFIPKYEVPIIRPTDVKFAGLYMDKLFKVTNFAEYNDLLNPIVEAYEKWIEQSLENKLNDLPVGFEDTAKNQIQECKSTAARIRRGIKIISEDPIAGESFAFANRAMYLQRGYGKWAQRNRENGGKVDGFEPKPEDFENTTWRLFQIAFILLNIESITDPKSDDRQYADLLWFPTGGGKTEAYLGLIAFTIGHRRLRHLNSNDDSMRYGVTVIMRYTLRLLTLQQFQRATLLMCACESIRRTEYISHTKELKWGNEPFYVGLWVGSNTTPNRHEGETGSIIAISQARNKKTLKEHNPIQLLSCPWCGSNLDGFNYDVDDLGNHIKQCRITCSRKTCLFATKKNDEEIPALVVDEDIYSRCPSLIIGTIDKFAQISWKEETGAIFGKVDRWCPKHGFVVTSFMPSGCNHKESWKSIPLLHSHLNPPELIVQDELHLISGPLGTLTGLYETAIDLLCTTAEGIRPKIIASTATTKKSREQILGLFNRTTSKIFPPQGFLFGDSFFAKEIPPKIERGKMYLGICSTSRSGITVQAKIAASILRKIRQLKENQSTFGFNEFDLDPYYTLVAYFNSMKELGNASKMYDDSVPGFIDTVYRKFEKDDQSEDEENPKIPPVPKDHRRNQLVTEELTSRRNAVEIPAILKSLETKLQPDKSPIDVLLCTNMLSVGVDISRLGVMIINGQPKNHSEYIQASGRIGRNSPGLILTNYSFLKPRDLSHYENFILYHSTFHKNVESVSLTPFSARARDRALFGVIVALVRLLEKRLALGKDAQYFDKPETWIDNLIQQIRSQIEARVDSIDKLELDGTLKDFDDLIKMWRECAKQRKPLQYAENKYDKAKKLEHTHYLMTSSVEESTIAASHDDIPIFVPNSLRDAEDESKLIYFVDDGIKPGEEKDE